MKNYLTRNIHLRCKKNSIMSNSKTISLKTQIKWKNFYKNKI